MLKFPNILIITFNMKYIIATAVVLSVIVIVTCASAGTLLGIGFGIVVGVGAYLAVR